MVRSNLRALQIGCLLGLWISGLAGAAPAGTGEAMDAVVSRLYAANDEAMLAGLDSAKALELLSPEEKTVLATAHWQFEVDAPAVISILRDSAQKEMPFWLAEAGFAKTELNATNTEDWVYEVWQKKVEPGQVRLGINGFENHRPHYLVVVGPQTPGTEVRVTKMLPGQFPTVEFIAGAMAYNDWTDLVFKTVPESLQGHTLLTTIRGRSRDAHLVGAFRRTDFPSSEQPDQVMLTWSGSPKTTQAIQWRTSVKVKEGAVRYAVKGSDVQKLLPVTPVLLEDRLLSNDRFIHRYTAELTGLQPDTTYVYSVGNPAGNQWSDAAEFTTAPAAAKPFTFLWSGDAHNRPDWGALMTHAMKRNPGAAFYTTVGDLVGTGQYRNNWDSYFEGLRQVANRTRIMPVLGNHDSIDGLGPDLYLQQFAMPQKVRTGIGPERAYSFEYGNALMIALDCTAPIEKQTAWLESVLKRSKATWKFAAYHFPNFEPEYVEEYADITREWGTLFDAYHVDMVFHGHVHYYMRSKPMKEGKVVASPAEGTIYVISIGLEDNDRPRETPEYAEKVLSGPGLYHTVRIDGNRLEFKALDKNDTLHDELVIQK